MELKYFLLVAFAATCLVEKANSDENGDYVVGVGIADVTGPAAELGMMGYANPSQSAQGIHTRLFSRAFVFQDTRDSPPAVFVSADIGMVDQALKFKVVERLQEKFGPDVFLPKNVLLSGTHTHSGPGAFLQYLMYGITSLGFMESSFNAIVDGMVQSIERAWASRAPGKLYINKGKVENANINRSPSSYLANPEEERNLYPDGDVDKDMVLVRIEGANGIPLGTVNWFAVHPTSMNNTNRLLSGDNKGYASMQFEYKMNPEARPGKGKFVAAFASSNLGDVSPNTNGPKCIDTGEPCDLLHSTCGGFVQNCIAFGPGKDMVESTEIIGRNQFEAALKLFQDENESAEPLVGDVGFIHQYVNMTDRPVEIKNSLTNVTVTKRTCAAAMGYSFAAGTTDGPGMFDFKQGELSGNPFWDTIRNFLKRPSPEMEDCQRPKPVLLPVGELKLPYDWVPEILETQILKVGNLFIIGIPGELTTMAGRRVRKAVENVVKEAYPDMKPHVVIAGLSNVYSHYIATFEEYQEQRYEAASTLYGPYTLDAHIQQYSLLAKNLLSGDNLAAGPRPPNLLNRQWSLIAPIVMDTAPLTRMFGDVLNEPAPTVNPGETVVTRFAGGHPRHNTMREGTFLLVERQVENSARWETVATDADWSTRFHWSRPRFQSSESVIEISWAVPKDQPAGFYRIRHFGYYKPLPGSEPRPYQGKTVIFKVNGPGSERMVHPNWSPVQKKPYKILSPVELWRALGSAYTGKK